MSIKSFQNNALEVGLLEFLKIASREFGRNVCLRHLWAKPLRNSFTCVKFGGGREKSLQTPVRCSDVEKKTSLTSKNV